MSDVCLYVPLRPVLPCPSCAPAAITAGQTVLAGQEVAVVEAMKMQVHSLAVVIFLLLSSLQSVVVVVN